MAFPQLVGAGQGGSTGNLGRSVSMTPRPSAGCEPYPFPSVCPVPGCSTGDPKALKAEQEQVAGFAEHKSSFGFYPQFCRSDGPL